MPNRDNDQGDTRKHEMRVHGLFMAAIDLPEEEILRMYTSITARLAS